MEKQELIAKLEEILPIMDKFDQYSRKLEGIGQRMGLLKSQIQERYRPALMSGKGWTIGFVVGVLAANILLKIANNTFTLILALAIIIVCIVLNIKIETQLFEAKKEPLRQELARREQEYEKVEQEMLAELKPCWQKILDIVPRDYIAPMFVKTVYGYLTNGRADSMKEAVNLFEEEQHRWRMEQGQQQMYEQYQTEIRSLQEVARELEQRVSAAEADAYAARAYTARNC